MIRPRGEDGLLSRIVTRPCALEEEAGVYSHPMAGREVWGNDANTHKITMTTLPLPTTITMAFTHKGNPPTHSPSPWPSSCPPPSPSHSTPQPYHCAPPGICAAEVSPIRAESNAECAAVPPVSSFCASGVGARGFHDPVFF